LPSCIRNWWNAAAFRAPLFARAQLHAAAGPEAQQLATLYRLAAAPDTCGIVAGGLFVLPSLLILIALSWAYLAFASWVWSQACFTASSQPLWPSCCTPRALASAH
jgi:hypothetical protein